jgi:hypothetical protein
MKARGIRITTQSALQQLVGQMDISDKVTRTLYLIFIFTLSSLPGALAQAANIYSLCLSLLGRQASPQMNAIHK